MRVGRLTALPPPYLYTHTHAHSGRGPRAQPQVHVHTNTDTNTKELIIICKTKPKDATKVHKRPDTTKSRFVRGVEWMAIGATTGGGEGRGERVVGV